ncbi:DUF4124 domain-containing protein [Endozoicomonas sp. G2_1]|uniref:DUF4124 domain-containing protein n=1 Tax=Endozoicomonas sp. G2_1 TaxID=2821091 RepID=UPI001ADB80E1|nr:DUF4124 domain-containing protein [Endozoicomonas sp. G2_1]MBO9490297.1 DUF4124 domain-containing protein [Endozoicomonas sp. G2_1]
MDIIRKSVVLSTLLLLSNTTVSAEGMVIYRWVDEDNVVHFSQHQPSHNNYTEITMAKSATPAPSESPSVASDLSSTLTNNETSPANQSLVAQKMAERCEEAKQNIKTLTNFDDIQYTDEDGNTTLLSEEDKKQQLALSQRQVEVYCEQ